MKVLKFGATWCPGCLIMRPRWQEIETERPWLKTEYFDYDGDSEIVVKWQIDEILPTFVFLDKNSKELFRLRGEKSKAEIIRLIDDNKDK